MSELDAIRQRRKNKNKQSLNVDTVNHEKKNINKKDNTSEKDFYKLKIFSIAIRTLICTILFLIVSISFKLYPNTKNFVKTNIFEKHFSFAFVNKLYEDTFGDITPTILLNPNIQSVFQDKFTYKSVEEHNKSALLTVDKNYLIPVLKSGMVIFIGEKEGLGNTIIIQQTDNVDLWYSNVTNVNVSLYDYVTEKQLLAEAASDKLFLTFKKGNEYLDYEEYLN